MYRLSTIVSPAGTTGSRLRRGAARRSMAQRSMALASASVLACTLCWTAVPVAATGVRLVDRGSWGWYGSGGTGSSSSSTTGTGTTATASEEWGVVLINTVLSYAGAEAAGTGMVLTASGEVLTNYHVVEGSTTVEVMIATTGKTYSASVVGTDKTDDVAVLQLSGATALQTVRIDSDSVSVGNDVTAVGNAGGTNQLTAASGTVTALRQTITTQAEATAAAETLRNLIETNADVQAGDSGGPLYDSHGEVLGMDTAASSGGAVQSYAIPIASALDIAARSRAATRPQWCRSAGRRSSGLRSTRPRAPPTAATAATAAAGVTTGTTARTADQVAGGTAPAVTAAPAAGRPARRQLAPMWPA